MSDETTAQPEPAGPEATTEATREAPATAVATLDPPEPAEASDPPPAPPDVPDAPPAPGTPAAPRKRSVQVPVWLLVVVIGLGVVAGAFFVGRATAPESGDDGPDTLAEAAEMTARGDMEVGDFDLRLLLDALRNNDSIDLGTILDLLEGQGRR